MASLVGEDADDLGAALDLAVEALDRVGRVQLGPVLLREAHVGEHVGLGLVHQRGELRDLGAELVGDLAPLGPGGVGVVLGEGGGDEGGDDAAALFAGMGQHVAHEVHAAALPGGVQHLGDRGLQPFMGVRDHQLDAAQAAPGELAQELGPEGLGLRRRRSSMPSTSRRPSPLTPTAMITATETMRPSRRDLHVGRVEPDIGPIAFERPVEEGLRPCRRSRRTAG